MPGSAWIIRQWWTKDGKFALQPAGPHQPPAGLPVSSAGRAASAAAGGNSPAQCLAQHGYTQLTSYQPASRFWPFQWIEGGWLLALSALLIAATVWLVRRRAA